MDNRVKNPKQCETTVTSSSTFLITVCLWCRACKISPCFVDALGLHTFIFYIKTNSCVRCKTWKPAYLHLQSFHRSAEISHCTVLCYKIMQVLSWSHCGDSMLMETHSTLITTVHRTVDNASIATASTGVKPYPGQISAAAEFTANALVQCTYESKNSAFRVFTKWTFI